MKSSRLLNPLLSLFLLCACASLVYGTSESNGPSPEVRDENQPEQVEMYRLSVENSVGGGIALSREGGKTWIRLGQVATPTRKVNTNGFTASQWAISGRVCATAVNAIHVKVRNDPTSGRGVVFSIVPAEQGTSFKAGAASANPTAVIYTDIPGGTGIFGRWTPLVNGRVIVVRNGSESPLSEDYAPEANDRLVFPVERVKRLPKAIEFENRFGGLIRILYPEETRIIGEVLRPVLGVGRFDGSLFADVGRVRANHPGVLDISTSPYGEVGGFQIVPANHAMSQETTYVRRHTQWMVVGPVNATDPSWEGTAPLFAYFIQPRYDPGDLYADDWAERLLSRFRIEVRLNGGDWQSMPAVSVDSDLKKALPESAFIALKDVTHIRILFPDPWYYGGEGA